MLAPLQKNILAALVLLWTFFASGAWFFTHKDFFGLHFAVTEHQNLFLDIFSPVIVLASLAAIFVFMCKRRNVEKLEFSGSWLMLVIGYYLFLYLLFVFAGHLRIPGVHDAPPLAGTGIVTDHLVFLTKMSASLLWILLTALVAYLLGSPIVRWTVKDLSFIRDQKNSFLLHLSAIACGLWILSMILFVLGSFSLFTAPALTILLIALLLLRWRETKKLFTFFTEKRTITFSPFALSTWLVVIVSVFFAFNLIDTLRFHPIGYDDSIEYLNRAQLMASDGALVPGTHPYVFSLLAVPGYLLSGTGFFAFSGNILYVLLGFLALYGLTRSLSGSVPTSILVGAAWLTLPITNEYVARVTKVEPLLFFVTTLALWLLVLWHRSSAHSQKNRIALLMLLLLGFAVSVKLLAFLFVIPVCIVLAWNTLRHKALSYKFILTSIAFFLLPLSIWIYHDITTPPTIGRSLFHTEPALQHLLVSENHAIPHITEETFRALGIDASVCSTTGLTEDLDRYDMNDSPILRFLRAPWDYTMNQWPLVYPHSSEIGFLYLTVTGILLILLLAGKLRNISSLSHILLFLAVTYWILWFLIGRGIIWYGYPGLVFGLVAVPLLLKHLPRHTERAVTGVLLLGIFTFFLLRASAFGSFLVFERITEHEVKPPFYFASVAHYLNNDPTAKILSTGTPAIYHINDNHKRVVRDTFLDTFVCLDSGQDDKQTLRRLQQLGITHILYGKSTPAVEADPHGTLHEKTNRFLEFAEEALIATIDQAELTVFDVPQP